MINKTVFLISIVVSTLFFGCSAPLPHPVKIEKSNEEINYLNDVKPILDKRCVNCHSCYNSPCQAKYGSFEGIDRGASKLMVYDALRIHAANPTRLFIDANSTEEWREKDFFSVTKKFDANESFNDSIMMHMLHQKKLHPEVVGSYKPELDELVCPKNPEEMGEYIEDKPNHGMPYGMPSIEESEYKTLTQWIARGAKGPSLEEQQRLTTPSEKAKAEIEKWESFLNNEDAKHVMSARYLYEHLFIAHLHFTSTGKEFFRIVRSKTPSPKPIQEIASVRPYDDPMVDKFYYRLQKIHETIVHKTHIVFELNDTKLSRINELFIEPKWEEKPHVMSYDVKASANPFVTFAQIPVRSRYQFMLDNSHYIVMSFIRGPVCRGQIAVNVIHDHFWVMFQDPDSDISVVHPEFLLDQASNLSMPIESSTQKLWDTFSDSYRNKYKTYFKAKENLIRAKFQGAQDINSIWKGNTKEDSPLLSVYRHFDSATVLHGTVGGLPRTAWVIDYPQFEKIYYLLVAGFDVFGNVSHQTNTRRYFDYLRMEGEVNFLTYMPANKRLEMFKSWYLEDDDVQDMKSIDISQNVSNIKYKTKYPKSEFLEKVVKQHIRKDTKVSFDSLNYFKEYEKTPEMPKVIKTHEDIKIAMEALTAPGTSFIRHITDNDINTVFIRVTFADKSTKVYTLVINRWHNNVNSLFGEEDALNPDLDTLDIIEGYVGSYPNAFVTVEYQDLLEFFDILQNFDRSEVYMKKIFKYFVRRGDKDFWKTYDWFQSDFNKKEPIHSGLYDLNRYYHK